MNKSCPFDKSSVHVLSVTKCKGIYGFMIYRVFCTCGASGPWKNFPEEAWTAWNTRPGEDELQAKLAAALEVCRELVKECTGPDWRMNLANRLLPIKNKARKVVEE